ncbi:MAG: hypothetical protein AAGF74_00775 [Pseudomonadota bacterium]
MTDDGIEKIYLIVEAALIKRQESVDVHAFPFRMTEKRLNAAQANTWYGYWQNLKAGYDLFEGARVPPRVFVLDSEYAFEAG